MSDFRTWDQLTVVEQLQCNYSDFYKSVHGFRPRGASTEQWNSEVWLSQQMDMLHLEAQIQKAREMEAEKKAIEDFEKRVSGLMEIGAKDRVTALRWILEAENDPYVINDPDYFCFNNGLPYGYLKDIEY